MTATGPVLVEAKAHIREFFSPHCRAGPASMAQIRQAFAAVQTDLGTSQTRDWAELDCQYANCLTYLW